MRNNTKYLNNSVIKLKYEFSCSCQLKNRESIRDATAELQVKIIWSCFINKQETKE